jgi:hypothetical protein
MPVFTVLALQEVTRQGLRINYSRCYTTWYSLYSKGRDIVKGMYCLRLLVPGIVSLKTSRNGPVVVSLHFIAEFSFAGRRREKIAGGFSREKIKRRA